MSLILRRIVFSPRPHFHPAIINFARFSKKRPKGGKEAGADTDGFGDPIEHATGLEKRELLAKLAGNENPFCDVMLKRGPGTKEEPNEIPSAFASRLIGCVCEEDSTHINYMWLYKDTPTRCECGYWFKLVPVSPL